MEDLNNDELWDAPSTESSASTYQEPDDYSGFNPEDDSYYDDSGDNDDYSNEDDQDNQDSSKESLDYLSRLLKNKGVDREKVRIENDKGEIEEWKFDDLDEETKYGILYNDPEDDLPLTDDEIDTVNFLRDQDMTLPQLIEYEKQQAIKEYLEQNQTVNYEVDKVSDDDLFKFDLLDQMPDLTDEEVEDQLTRAKENETFFNKRIAALRKEYKELQDQQIQNQKDQEIATKENAFNTLAQSYVNVATGLDEINGMELEDSDKEEILSFMLDRDASGQTKFYKMFADPQMAFKMAWYALKGEEAYTALTDYYQSEIAKARRNSKQEKPLPTRSVRRTKTNKYDDPYGLS